MNRIERSYKDIQTTVIAYYSQKVLEHGASAKGVDWRDEQSQEMRFQQLLYSIFNDKAPFLNNKCSILDYGCGYGALLSHISSCATDIQYQGFDWSKEMIKEAVKQHPPNMNVRFFSQESELEKVDFVFASGIFNVRLTASNSDFSQYVEDTLHTINRLSRKGFAFNMLTSYSDLEKMREDLFYADPLVYFDYCMKQFSRSARLLHGYGLYEFTIGVRKDEGSLDACK